MNTAGRLLVIYDSLVNAMVNRDKAMVWVWAQVFEIPEANPHVEDDVVACLLAMRSEVDLLSLKLAALGVSEQMLHPGLPRLRNISSPGNLNAGANGYRDELARPENRVLLLWADWALRDENEEALSADELAGLYAELDALEASIREIEMPSYLQDFVVRQIALIRSALLAHRVRGGAAIKEAVRQIVGSCVVEGEHVATEAGTASAEVQGVMARMGAVIKKTVEIADRFEKVRKAGEGAYGLAKTVAPILLAWISK